MRFPFAAGHGRVSSGGSVNTGHHEMDPNSRHTETDAPSSFSGSRASASGGGNASPPAVVAAARWLRCSRSARPRATAPATSPRVSDSLSTDRADATSPSAPSDARTPNFASVATRSPASNGGAGKCSRGSKSARRLSTRGSNTSEGRASAPHGVGTHAWRRIAVSSFSTSAAPVHDARAAASDANAASNARGADDDGNSPEATAGNAKSARTVAGDARVTPHRVSSSLASASPPTRRNAEDNSVGSASEGANSGAGDASSATKRDDPASSPRGVPDAVSAAAYELSTKTAPASSPAAASARSPLPAPAPRASPRGSGLIFFRVSKIGSDRRRSKRAPSSFPPAASGSNHLFCARNARKARLAGGSARSRTHRGTAAAAARHLRSGDASAGTSAAASSSVAAAATALSNTPAADAGRTYVATRGCATAAAATTPSRRRRTPIAASASAAGSVHPSPRTIGPWGVSGARRSPASTGRSGHPSNAERSSGLVAASRRHKSASASASGSPPDPSARHATVRPHPRAPFGDRHAAGSVAGRNDASARASTSPRLSAAPVARDAIATSFSDNPGTVAHASTSTRTFATPRFRNDASVTSGM